MDKTVAELIEEALTAARRTAGSREAALVVTKLEEAAMWEDTRLETTIPNYTAPRTWRR